MMQPTRYLKRLESRFTANGVPLLSQTNPSYVKVVALRSLCKCEILYTDGRTFPGVLVVSGDVLLSGVHSGGLRGCVGVCRWAGGCVGVCVLGGGVARGVCVNNAAIKTTL